MPLSLIGRRPREESLLWWTELGEKVGGDGGRCLLQTRKGILVQQSTQTHAALGLTTGRKHCLQMMFRGCN